LRLTGFPSPGAAFEGGDWWEEVVGQPPEVEISKRRTGGHQYEGPVDFPKNRVGKLILTLRPDRIDWVLTVEDGSEADSAEIQTLGDFDTAVSEFSRMASRWFDVSTCPPVHRIAFGAVLVWPVADRPAGYKRLSKFVPVNIDPVGSSDFLYQINRPREAAFACLGLKINRLSKWSVLRHVQSRLLVSPSSVKGEPVQTRLACRLELDINTSQEHEKDIAREHLGTIFGELIELGKEIAKKGDLP
jgi:hypothetical protein